MVDYNKIRELGELALIMPFETAYNETTVRPWDYFTVEDYQCYQNDTGDVVMYRMEEFDDLYYGYSPMDLAEVIERAEWFSVEDDYFVREGLGTLRSLTRSEAKKYLEEHMDMRRFIRWARENNRYTMLNAYLTEVQGELARRHGLDTVIIEF